VICSFLNSGGGQIVVGVTQEGERARDVTKEEVLQAVYDLTNGLAGGRLVPPALCDVTKEGEAVVVDIPAGLDRPYLFDDAIYVRRGIASVPANAAEVRRLIEDRYLEGDRWERQPFEGLRPSELDQEQILLTAKGAAKLAGRQFRDKDDPEAVLEDLRLMRDGRLTNAAVLLFSEDAGQIFPQSRVRAVRYDAEDRDEIADTKMFDGHLITQLSNLVQVMRAWTPVRSVFNPEDAQRNDLPSFPFWPIREGLCNALIHRDYRSKFGRVSIEFSPEELRIWSFGKLPQGLDAASLSQSNRSAPVNPDLAGVFFMLGYVELLGRGTRKIVEVCKTAKTRRPKWEEVDGGLCLTLYSALEEWERPLTDRQREMIELLGRGDRITFAEVYRVASVSERSVRGDLGRLVSLGYLTRKGDGRNTSYERTGKPAIE
jgi:ATP-dependent DNA helicase RecG